MARAGDCPPRQALATAVPSREGPAAAAGGSGTIVEGGPRYICFGRAGSDSEPGLSVPKQNRLTRAILQCERIKSGTRPEAWISLKGLCDDSPMCWYDNTWRAMRATLSSGLLWPDLHLTDDQHRRKWSHFNLESQCTPHNYGSFFWELGFMGETTFTPSQRDQFDKIGSKCYSGTFDLAHLGLQFSPPGPGCDPVADQSVLHLVCGGVQFEGAPPPLATHVTENSPTLEIFGRSASIFGFGAGTIISDSPLFLALLIRPWIWRFVLRILLNPDSRLMQQLSPVTI
ncbi:hypothetical protein B0H14DRAFT_2590757 [Mycena olivaceomarginata]|nr:hypothetical protein B0H14DRAFT_2590757 [Mycena olivaceomarginata]